MLKSLVLILSIALFQFSLTAQKIDKDKSIVNFKIGNMGGLNSVKGTFSGFSGNVVFSPHDLSSAKIDVCIDASTVNTGNKKRDNHLRTEDFFEVEKYPKICFNAKEIIKSTNGFIAKGTLKMHGVTKTVEIPLTYENNMLTGKLKVNRFDYKIGEDTGTFMVGTEAEITINCQLKPQ
ncbi:MAG TPA: YceI family protein [Brumimicrobium sp.]|nr:YceI family protein [Brumimicrobium sp.]